jgi:hypothetical protein
LAAPPLENNSIYQLVYKLEWNVEVWNM